MTKEIKELLKDETKFKEVSKMAFDTVDTDKSGLIDLKELSHVMEIISSKLGTNPPSKAEVKAILNHLDTDKSGKIDFNEFLALMRASLKSMK